MKNKNLVKLDAGSYRIGRIAIELWDGQWEVFDLENPKRAKGSNELIPEGFFKTLKEAVASVNQ